MGNSPEPEEKTDSQRLEGDERLYLERAKVWAEDQGRQEHWGPVDPLWAPFSGWKTIPEEKNIGNWPTLRCTCGWHGEQRRLSSCPRAGLDNHIAFPPVSVVPTIDCVEALGGSFYYASPQAGVIPWNKHWCVLGEILQCSVATVRPAALIRTRWDEEIVLWFYSSSSPETPQESVFKAAQYKPGNAIAILYGELKEMEDGSIGIRNEYIPTVYIFQCSLNVLLSKSRSLLHERCFTCDAPDAAILCPLCKQAKFCSSECANCTDGAHSALCEQLEVLRALCVLVPMPIERGRPRLCFKSIINRLADVPVKKKPPQQPPDTKFILEWLKGHLANIANNSEDLYTLTKSNPAATKALMQTHGKSANESWKIYLQQHSNDFYLLAEGNNGLVCLKNDGVKNRIALQSLLPLAEKQLGCCFQARWKATTGTEWNNETSPAELQKLFPQFLRGLLFEDSQVKFKTGTIEDWDITLLTALLKLDWGASYEAENEVIMKIKDLRNKISHNPTVSNSEFQLLRLELKDSLMQFGMNEALFDNYEVSYKPDPMVKSTSEYHCEQLKEKGNKHFIAKKWMEAVDFYTEALHYSAEISPNLVGILYKNRCAAYLSEAGNSENPSLGYLKKATQDAIEATKFTPYDAKAYYRLGSAYNAREKYEKAVKALERADVLSPNDPQVMSLLKECRQYAAKVERGEFQDTRFTAEPNYEDLYARFNMTAEQKEKFNTTINSAEFGKFVETLFPGKTRTNQGLKHLNKREFGLALREFTAAAAKGDAEGMFNLGYCYINGYGTKKNVSLAEYWYTKASEQPPFVRDMPNVGVAEGLHGLALILLNEPAILEKKKGFKLMEKAAELKLSLAQNSLGALYDKGEVVPRDKKKAIEFYKLAAEQGDAQAMLNLANSYAFEDTERALMWAEKAVSLGASQGLPLLLALRETKNAIEEEGEVKEEEEKVEESDLLFASRFAELLKIKTEPESTFHVNYNFSKEAMEECGSEYAQMFLSCYALKEKARKEFESGNFDAAVSLVAEMIRIPESSLIQVEQAFYEFPKFAPPSADSDLIDFRVITMTKSHNAVEAHAKLLIKKYPDEPYYYKMCGTSLSFEHRWDQAIQFFNSGLSLPLTKSNKDLECEFFYLLAIAERQNNLVDRSLRHYKQFLLLCPDSHRSVPTAHYSIANLISRKIKKSDPDGSIIDEVNFHYQKGLQAEKALPPVFRKKKMPCQVVVELLLSILRPEAIQDIRTTQAPANVTYNGDRPSSPLQQKTIGKSGSANGTNLGSSKKQETIATMEDRSNPNKQSPTTTTITATATKQKQIPKSPQLSLDQIVVAFLHTIKSNRHPLSFLIPAIAATKKWGDFKTLNGLYKPPLKKALSCSPELDFITENNAVIVILKPVMPSSESETAESSEEPPELETKEPCLELKNNFVIGDGEWQKQRGKKKSEQIQSPSTQKTQTQTAKPQQLRPQRQPKQPQSPQTHAPAKPPQPKQSQLPKTQARPSQPPAAKPQQPKQSQPPKTQAHPSQPPAAKPQQPKQTQPSKMQTRPSQPPAAKPQQPKQTQPPKTQTRPSQPKQTQPSKTQTRPSQPPAAKPQQPKQSQPPKTQTRPSQPPAAKATQISTTPKNPNPSQTTTNSIPEAARQTVSVSATTKNLKATNHTPLKF